MRKEGSEGGVQKPQKTLNRATARKREHVFTVEGREKEPGRK